MRSLALVLAALAVAPVAKVNVGNWNYGLAAAGGAVWSAGLVGGDVVRIDASTGKVTKRIPVGFRIFNLASAPGAVWAVDNTLGRVTRIDASTGKITARVKVGGAPYDVEWGFGSAWVSNTLDGTVSRVTGRRVVETIKVGVEPNGLSAIGPYLWVTLHTGNKLVRVDPRTNRVTGSVSLSGADWVTGYKGSLFVSQENNFVTRVSATTLKVTGRVKVSRNPLGSAIVRGKLWVPCIDGNAISVVDPATMKVVRTIPDSGGPIVALPLGNKVWVSHTTANDVREYSP
jgi:DNA-binding beta-propeller fold protein YncE